MMEINSEIINKIIDICGSNAVFVEKEVIESYSKDATLDLYFPFEVLVKPSSPEEIGSLLKLCNEYKIPVTPRGGGSGVTGGALPVQGGVLLSLERLDKIMEINTVGKYAIVESGVVTQVFCDAIENAGMFFPVIPSSSKISFIGGNVAENAGSISSCKYGVTRDYIVNMEVVLPTGEIIWTGTNVKKDVSGLNLTHLFIGSEGVLGVITKIVYRLINKPKEEVNLLIVFDSFQEVCQMVTSLHDLELVPSAVEYLSHEAIKLYTDYYEKSSSLNQGQKQFHLLIQLVGKDEEDIRNQLDVLHEIALKFTQYEILIGQSNTEKRKLWKIRLGLGEALTSQGRKYRDVDIAIPLTFMSQYISKLYLLAEIHSLKIIMFGHIIDGNLHAMIVLDEEKTHKEIDLAIKEIYKYAVSIGGTISGEHGIGFLQRDLMPIQFSSKHIDIMRKIKNVFDPKGILNPQKII